MKKILLTISFILSGLFILHSQTTFNKEIKVMDFITNPGPVLTYDDTILCLGHGTDTTTFSEYSLFVAKYDLEGNFIKRYIDTLGDYYFSYINDAYIVGENVIFAADSYQNGEFWGSYIMAMKITTGEVIKKIEITNPKDQYNYRSLAGLTQMDSITYAAVSAIDEEKEIDGKTHIDMQISIINIETEEVKYIHLGKEGVSDIPEFIVWNGEKFLIGTGILDPPYDILHPKRKSISYGFIYEVDTSGFWRKGFEADTMRAPILDIVLNNKGEYICTSYFNSWYHEPNSDEYIWHNHHWVFKLDNNFNLIWEKPWGLSLDFNWFASSARILTSESGDGYILAGYQPNYPWTKELGPWNVDQEIVDSLKDTGTIPMGVGILQKI